MDDTPTAPAARPCPICGKPTAQRFRPFCSARCRTLDLARWLDGAYRVPTDEAPDDPSPEAERDRDGG